MKPTLEIRNPCDSIGLAVPMRPVFPDTGFDYQATTLAELDGRCAGHCKSSFRAISQDYFADEAPQHFAQEGVLFVIMMITVALPLLNASIAILELIRMTTFQS
jgi:hypothetical protein